MKLLIMMLGVMMLVVLVQVEEWVYVIDLGYIYIVFEVECFGYVVMVGVFLDSFGEIVLDMDNLENSCVNVIVYILIVWIGFVLCDQVVNGFGFFNMAEYFEICFLFIVIELIDEDSVCVIGDFILLGVMCLVIFDVDFNCIGFDFLMGGCEGVVFLMFISFDCLDFGNMIVLVLIGDIVIICIEVFGYVIE